MFQQELPGLSDSCEYNRTMVKVLLVYEDFSELTLTQTYLKKIGFDVVGISNEILIHDQILSFNPDIIVANGKNMKVSSFSVGTKLKDSGKYQGKVILVVTKGVRPAAHEMIKMKMDGLIETPVEPEKLIQILCRLSGLAFDIVLDKLHKARLSDPELSKLVMVTGSPKPPLDDKARMSRYQDLVKDVHIDVQQTSHSRKEMKDKLKDLKKDWDYEQLEEQDELRRQFAEALFKKNQ